MKIIALEERVALSKLQDAWAALPTVRNSSRSTSATAKPGGTATAHANP